MTKAELEALFDKAITPGSVQAAQDYLAARARRDAAQASLDRASKEMADAEDVLCKKLDEAGVKSVVVEGNSEDFLVTAEVRSYFRVTTTDSSPADFVSWLFRSGGHDLLKHHVDERDLTKLCRRLEEEGRPIHTSIRKFVKRVVRVNNR